MPATPDSVDLSVVSTEARGSPDGPIHTMVVFITGSADHYCRDIRASTDGSASTSVVLHSGDILNHSGLSIGVDSNLKLSAELIGRRQLTDSDSYRTCCVF